MAYSMLLEEHHGSLAAKLLSCATTEHYLGHSPEANSTRVVSGFPALNFLKWNGGLSCSDARLAFPYNATNTTKMLTELCTLENPDKSARVSPGVTPVDSEPAPSAPVDPVVPAAPIESTATGAAADAPVLAPLEVAST